MCGGQLTSTLTYSILISLARSFVLCFVFRSLSHILVPSPGGLDFTSPTRFRFYHCAVTLTSICIPANSHATVRVCLQKLTPL
jgi:hypothetical protein